MASATYQAAAEARERRKVLPPVQLADVGRWSAGSSHVSSRSGTPHWPGRPSCVTATLKMLALPAAGNGDGAWAVLGPCGNRR